MSAIYEINGSETGGVRVEHTVRLTKLSERQLNDMRVARQVEAILAGVNNAARVKRGWKVEAIRKPTQEYNYDTAATGEYINSIDLTVVCTPEKERPTLETEFINIINSISSLGTVPKWKVTQVDGQPYTVKAPDEQEEGIADKVGYAPITIPDDWDTHFSHLYGLEAQINRIRRALDAAELSDWRNRFHAALIGPPGCGKSDICQSIKRALGEESVLEFDATSTSMAGAQKELADREELPRVLLVEEIEKAPEHAMAWLLSVLDIRAEIRKTTARGNILRDTKMLCVATVNDYPTFQKAQFGALESRFSNKIFVQRPPRALLERILQREIGRIKGDLAWIEPTLDYADEKEISDPRTLVAVALCGREQLLTGKYQSDLQATSFIGGWEK